MKLSRTGGSEGRWTAGLRRAGRGPGRSPAWVQSGQGGGGGAARMHAAARPHPRHAACTERSGRGAARRRAQAAGPAHWGADGRASRPLPPGPAGALSPGPVLDGQGGAPGHLGLGGPGPLRPGPAACSWAGPRCHSSGRGPTQGGRGRGWRDHHLPACHRCTAARHPPGTSQGTAGRKGREPNTHQGERSKAARAAGGAGTGGRAGGVVADRSGARSCRR